jgi:N-acetylneuraminic acid mutarotase
MSQRSKAAKKQRMKSSDRWLDAGFGVMKNAAIAAAALSSLFMSATHAGPIPLSFSRLPDLPDREGFAAMFAGVSGEALIIAGGANFPDKRPWEGGTKVWRDEVWLLESPAAHWKVVGRLPRPLAYGVCATFKSHVICAGGSNAEGHHADCFALRWENGELKRSALPSLPAPCANACGAIVKNTLYVAGGIGKPDAIAAMQTFWSLDLDHPEVGWNILEPWPGKERMLAVAASLRGSFYLCSGAALHADAEGQPEREWLNDAFRFTPGRGWEKLPPMPRVAVAAPSPAPVDANQFYILSGDDGGKFGFKPETGHPGFPRDAWRFDVNEGRWLPAGTVPFSRATVPTTRWREKFVIPSGEARPGYRSNEVWQLELR